MLYAVACTEQQYQAVAKTKGGTVNKNLMKIAETEEFLNLGKNTVKSWIDHKKCPFPFLKIGNSIRIKLSDLEKFMDQNTIVQLQSKDVVKEIKRRGRPPKVIDLSKVTNY